MAASRLQTEPASRARLEDELSKLFAQEIAAGRMLGDSQSAAPHGGAEPLDQPRLANDQAVSLRRAGERAIAADQADADVRRCFRQQFRSGVAEAALIEDEEVEAGEVRCDQGELLAQRSLRQAQRRRDGEPVRLDVEEHERAVVATTGEIEAGRQGPAHFSLGCQHTWRPARRFLTKVLRDFSASLGPDRTAAFPRGRPAPPRVVRPSPELRTLAPRTSSPAVVRGERISDGPLACARAARTGLGPPEPGGHVPLRPQAPLPSHPTTPRESVPRRTGWEFPACQGLFSGRPRCRARPAFQAHGRTWRDRHCRRSRPRPRSCRRDQPCGRGARRAPPRRPGLDHELQGAEGGGHRREGLLVGGAEPADAVVAQRASVSLPGTCAVARPAVGPVRRSFSCPRRTGGERARHLVEARRLDFVASTACPEGVFAVVTPEARPPAAAIDEERVRRGARLPKLLDDLDAHRALTAHHVGIVEGRHQRHAALALDPLRPIASRSSLTRSNSTISAPHQQQLSILMAGASFGITITAGAPTVLRPRRDRLAVIAHDETTKALSTLLLRRARILLSAPRILNEPRLLERNRLLRRPARRQARRASPS